MAKKSAKKKAPKVAPKDDGAALEKAAEDEAKGKKNPGEKYGEFVKGGRFDHSECENVEGLDLKYLNAKYIDSDGEEYDAKIPPLPLNKGNIGEVPPFENPEEEYGKVAKLPMNQQMKALQALQEKLSTPSKAFFINGESKRLVEYEGHLFMAIERKGNLIPQTSILVNFAKKGQRPNWQAIRGARPKEFVGTPPQGDRLSAHFVLA